MWRVDHRRRRRVCGRGGDRSPAPAALGASDGVLREWRYWHGAARRAGVGSRAILPGGVGAASTRDRPLHGAAPARRGRMRAEVTQAAEDRRRRCS